MGHGAVFDLIHNSAGVESVTVADFDVKKAEAVATAVGTSRVDVRDGQLVVTHDAPVRPEKVVVPV